MSSAAAETSVYAELTAITGEQHVCDDVATMMEALPEVVPAIRVRPGSVAEVGAVLRAACARKLGVVTAGGYTRQHIGNPPERAEILLDTSRLTAVEHYDPGDLTFGAGAGMALAEVEELLGEHGQMLPLDGDPRATLGGLMATNASSPLKHGYGGLRDFCIGVRFVTGDGKPAKGGGRVVKNVAGYDLMKLMIGSFGTLGVITGASFKVFPRPPQTATWVCEFATLAEAVEFRDTVARSPLTPMALELLSPRALEYLDAAGEPRDPDHYHPATPVGAPETTWRIAVRAGGSDRVLARYRAELGTAATRELSGGAESDFWRGMRRFEEHVAARHRNAMLLQASVPAAGVREALAGAEHAALDQNCLFAAVGRAWAGPLTVALLPLSVDPPSAMQFANAASAIRGALPPDSSAYVLRCPSEAKAHFDVWGTTATDRSVMLAVKRALDPHEVLNRGRFLL